MNSLDTHNASALVTVFGDYNDPAFAQIARALREEHEPASAFETVLIDQLILALYRTRKAAQAEPEDGLPDNNWHRYASLAHRMMGQSLRDLERHRKQQAAEARAAEKEQDKPKRKKQAQNNADGEDESDEPEEELSEEERARLERLEAAEAESGESLQFVRPFNSKAPHIKERYGEQSYLAPERWDINDKDFSPSREDLRKWVPWYVDQTPEEIEYARQNWKERIAMVMDVNQRYPHLLTAGHEAYDVSVEQIVGWSNERLIASYRGLTDADIAAVEACREANFLGPLPAIGGWISLEIHQTWPPMPLEQGPT